MQTLKKIPYFLILLAVFFCLHGSLENYGFVEAGEVIWVGVMVLAGLAVLFGLLAWITRPNYRLAGLISFFIGLWYLFFGALYDFVERNPLLHFFQRFSILISILILCTVIWTIWLKRKKAMQEKMTFYLNVLLLIYCLVDITMLSVRVLQSTTHKKAPVNFDVSRVKAKPNVYFLLFDEYPGYKSLKDSFHFANDSLYGYLHQQQFRILPVFSNYHFTLFSMSSILNMEYVEPGYVPLKVTQHDFQLRINEIRHAAVVDLFKGMGYQFRNLSIFDVADQHGVADQNSFLPVHSVLLTDKILHNRLIRSTGWWMKRFPLWKRRYMFQHEENNLYSEKKLVQLAAKKKQAPVFCYAHFMMPHGPFYRDSTGMYNPDEQIDDEFQWTRAAYLSYVKYTNTVIRSLVSQLISSDPGAIIVVMSDHGYRTYANKDPYEPFNYNNICAVRFPDQNYIDFREKWSTVNFFRYLFNCEFNQQLPYLADSTIHLSY